jgi:hypothetical protein
VPLNQLAASSVSLTAASARAGEQRFAHGGVRRDRLQRCRGEEAPRHPLEMPTAVDGDSRPSAARITRAARQQDGARRRDRHAEAARCGALGTDRHAAHHDVETAGLEVGLQRCPTHRYPADREGAVARIGARQCHIEAVALAGWALLRERSVVTARADTQKWPLGSAAGAGQQQHRDPAR